MIPGQRPLPALLCLLQVGAVAGLVVSHNPVMDELGHLPAGVRHWQSGEFDLYKVNPPLVRLVAAVPPVVLGAQTDWRRVPPDPRVRGEFNVGVDFVVANQEGSWSLFNLGRLALLPFGIVGLLACYALAHRLYGPAAGILAAALWTLCPNVSAYQGLILPDAPAAAMGVLAAYAFWNWLARPSWGGALLSGAALGAAWLTKTTLLIFAPLWLALAVLTIGPRLLPRVARGGLTQLPQQSS